MPRTKEQIVAVIKAVVSGIVDVTDEQFENPATTLDAIGIDSLDKLGVAMGIESMLGFGLIDDGIIAEWNTIGDIISTVVPLVEAVDRSATKS